jgi:hypothetical protein
MTRILSELLRAEEPHFRLQLHQLERVSGHKNVDIRLTVEVVQAAKQKIKQLGLDPEDTTTEELYHVLLARVSADDKRLERALRTRAATHISAEADLMAGMAHALQAEAEHIVGFSIKPAALKRLLKNHPAKRLMKRLGYRSADAMLRNETPAVLVAAAYSVESLAWRKTWLDSYKQLRPADFESRRPQIMALSGKRWEGLAAALMAEKAHTVLSLPELGSVILLPLPAEQERPSGMVIASVAIALQELNEIAAAANYLRASQVHKDFAARVQVAATGRVQLHTPLMAQALPWRLVERYFATTKSAITEDVFGPYIQAADFTWHDIEARLSKLCPSMAFWEGTSYVTFLHEGHAVSCNVLDAAVSACNRLHYTKRSQHHARQALWNELTLRYLDHESVERAVASVLQPQLAFELANE